MISTTAVARGTSAPTAAMAAANSAATAILRVMNASSASGEVGMRGAIAAARSCGALGTVDDPNRDVAIAAVAPCVARDVAERVLMRELGGDGGVDARELAHLGCREVT